ncbi:YqzL family protein [Halalkalibacterium ligniniphilum]|nr:YqzL family protein [Halalkalibacterium ligniniphilum]
MLNLSWKVFSMTGSIDTYLLLKELERESDETSELEGKEPIETMDAPTH